MCDFMDLGCYAGELAGTAAESAVGAVAQAVLDGLNLALTSLGSFWLDVDTISVDSSDGARAFITGHTEWLVGVIAAASIMVAGIKMAWDGKGQPAREVLQSLLTLVVVSGAGVTAVQLLIDISDVFSEWIIDQAGMGTDFASAILSVAVSSQVGLMAIILMGILALLASLVQIGLMVVRSALLVLLTGVLPLAASATNTEWGKEWFKKVVGWLVAFILFKPTASVIYATAIKLVAGDDASDDELVQFVMGACLLVLAVVALPALMKFVVPSVAALSSGGGGGTAAAMGVGALASGAADVARSSNSGGGGASSGGGGGSTGGSSSASGADSAASGGKHAASQTGADAGSASSGGAAGGAAAAGAGAATGGVATAVKAGADVAKGVGQAAASTAESQTGDGPSGAVQSTTSAPSGAAAGGADTSAVRAEPPSGEGGPSGAEETRQ